MFSFCHLGIFNLTTWNGNVTSGLRIKYGIVLLHLEVQNGCHRISCINSGNEWCPRVYSMGGTTCLWGTQIYCLSCCFSVCVHAFRQHSLFLRCVVVKRPSVTQLFNSMHWRKSRAGWEIYPPRFGLDRGMGCKIIPLRFVSLDMKYITIHHLSNTAFLSDKSVLT